MIKFIFKLFVLAGAVLLIARFVPGIHVTDTYTAFLVAVVWAVIGVTILPVLKILTLPINFLSLGLFTFVLHALLFWAVGFVVPQFVVTGFVPALEGSVVLTVVGWVLHKAL